MRCIVHCTGHESITADVSIQAAAAAAAAHCYCNVFTRQPFIMPDLARYLPYRAGVAFYSLNMFHVIRAIIIVSFLNMINMIITLHLR